MQELRRTAELVTQKLGREEWNLAYSSRSGNPRDPWLEPDVSYIIRQEAARGIKEVFFIPIGFIADHVEILYDLDVEAHDLCGKLGIKMVRALTVAMSARTPFAFFVCSILPCTRPVKSVC